ncbi:protocadherin Fat 4 isoform X3 [Procambarus clarkii]|uniref:protocadherin Fat 4 isoform X3 n=1 Tax=Procambarus clarkii TaxID=6728 RepID=UPI003742E9E6
MKTKVRHTLTSSVMASPGGGGRSPSSTTLRAAAILILLAIFPSSVKSACIDHFVISSEATLNGMGTNLILSMNVDEEAGVNTELYTLSWDETITYEDPVNTEFNQYFTVDSSGPSSLTTTVKTSLHGVPDYPNNIILIEGIVTFSQFSNGDTCSIQMSHTIIDENTETPATDQSTYALNLREDYPVNLPIYTLTVSVRDDDGSSPNNLFTVAVEGCPLRATLDQYGGASGSPQPVQFLLTSKLDFETQETYTCSVTATDQGVPPRTSTASTITLTVEDEPDEPPKFTYDYYYTQVISSQSSVKPLEMEPGDILAQDGDTTINSPITYTMRDARSDVPGTNYFTINADTADVTITTDLDDTILTFMSVTFIITGTDTSGTSSSVTLRVDLPPVSTTTVSTTDVTCPACTCPAMTTQEVPATTCPLCPTEVPATTCPVCPTDAIITPCPTEVPATTCPLCPTEATTTTCPVCPTEAIITPCPTEVPATTCPVCPTDAIITPCPTEASTTTCPLCPTDETTTSTLNTCPPVTCPSYTTTTEDSSQQAPRFTKDAYSGETFPESENVFQVSVYEDGSGGTEFSWESGDDDYFAINPTSGWITTKKDYTPPRIYELVAVASSISEPQLKDRAQVTIKVVSTSAQNATITNSLVTAHVREDNAQMEIVAVINTEGYTEAMCIIEAQPQQQKDKFQLDLENGTWVLKKIAALDFEETRQITLKIEAYDVKINNCSEISNSNGDNLLRSQGLVVITVDDVNDMQPQFVVPGAPNATVAYPVDQALQSVVGPVITLAATDEDTVGTVTYGLANSNPSGTFRVENDTGAVYVEKEFLCNTECTLVVTASDGVKQLQEASIKVLPLDMNNIFTLVLEEDVSQVDQFLNNISHQAGVQVSKLYVSPILEGATTSARAGVQSLYWTTRALEPSTLHVHVYSIDKNNHIMNLDELNKALSKNTEVVAQVFADRSVFQGDGGGSVDDTGLKVAVGILGALLGLILIAALVLFIYMRKKRGHETKVEPRPINTLGQAYPNLSFSDDREGGAGESRRSSSHKTNGTVNSATNGVGTFGRRDSPPLFMSALSFGKSESPKTQQQRGLRRVDPGTPEYYGISSPAPPPSFTTPTTATEAFTSFSDPVIPVTSSSLSKSSAPHTSSMYPSLTKPEESPPPKTPPHIYPNINILPKNDPPPITKTPTKSILKSYINSDEGASSTAPSGIVTVEKPAEPDADYDDTDEPPTSGFSALKGSPPPRKHSSGPGGDDDDDSDSDQGKTITYPGGKKSNLKHDTDDGSDDEKKSVAFKVLVDTKEIEAENLGPSQKAAVMSDALELMEANKKKLEAEGSDDFEEDEQL